MVACKAEDYIPVFAFLLDANDPREDKLYEGKPESPKQVVSLNEMRGNPEAQRRFVILERRDWIGVLDRLATCK